MIGALSLALVLGVAQESAAVPPVGVATFSLEDLGLTDAVRLHHSRSTLVLPLPTRSDRVLTAARLTLRFTDAPSRPEVVGLEVLVNQERVDALTARELADPQRTRAVTIPPALIGEHNTLTLRLLVAEAAACADRVAPGVWSFLAGGALEMGSSPLRLPNDLAILPMPFYDEAFDHRASVPVAFLRPPAPAEVRVAAAVASWIGLRGGARFAFPVSVGALPSGNAVVLAEGGADAQALGLPAPRGPALRLIDNPRAPGGADKLLVVMGRDARELETAALALSGGARLAGEGQEVAPPPPAAPAAAYDAPRWLPVSPFLPLSQIAGAGALAHEGTDGATLRLHFRLPPDLFFWLDDQPALDLSYGQVLGLGVKPARVDVELNGHFLGTLPEGKPGAGGTWGRARLPINRDHLAGYNELLIHLDYGAEACGGAASVGTTRFSVDGGASGFRFDRYTHFASLPDLSLFVHDGFPFTRRPDLAETVAVLPDRPEPSEIATLLSVVAGLSAVTGRPASALTVVSVSDFLGAPGPPRDLLVVGAVADQPLVHAFRDQLPLRLGEGPPRLALPARTALEGVRLVLAGRLFDGELGRGNEVLAHLPRFAAALAIESPLAPGRSAVLITAADPADMPTLGALQGRAESRYRGGDVLVLGPGDERWMFRVGPRYQAGALSSWHGFLWRLSEHWVALFPSALLGIALCGLVLRWALRGRVQRRLAAWQGAAP